MNRYSRMSDGSIIYYKSKSEICFRPDGSTVEDYITDNEVWKSNMDSTLTDIQNNIKNELINKIDSITADSLGAVKKTGDVMTGQLQRAGISSTWVAGRDLSFIRQTTSAANVYCPVLSVKSETGSWELGTYQADIFHISHISDANYNAGNNIQTADFQFTKDGRLIAPTFVGALSGKATSAGAADTATTAYNLNYFLCTASGDVGLWATNCNAIGYVLGTGNIYGITDGALIRQMYSPAWGAEIYIDYRTGRMASRGLNNGSWTGWVKPITNISSNSGEFNDVMIDYFASLNRFDFRMIRAEGRGSYSQYFSPVHDNDTDLGSHLRRWRQLYAANSTIVTSDRAAKYDENTFEDDFIVHLIMGLIPKTFKFKDNQSGRTHYGFIAQDIEDLIQDLGIDSKDIAAFIKAPKTRRIRQENTNTEDKDMSCSYCEEIIPEGEEGYGFNYFLRYEEFISPLTRMVQLLYDITQKQTEKINNLESEISNILSRLEELEKV